MCASLFDDRLWIIPNESGLPPQQLGHFNVVPLCTDGGGFLSGPKFQTFAETISALNSKIRSQPIPGRDNKRC